MQPNAPPPTEDSITNEVNSGSAYLIELDKSQSNNRSLDRIQEQVHQAFSVGRRDHVMSPQDVTLTEKSSSNNNMADQNGSQNNRFQLSDNQSLNDLVLKEQSQSQKPLFNQFGE